MMWRAGGRHPMRRRSVTKLLASGFAVLAVGAATITGIAHAAEDEPLAADLGVVTADSFFQVVSGDLRGFFGLRVDRFGGDRPRQLIATITLPQTVRINPAFL